MNKLTGDQIRQTYLNFFREREHLIVPSSSLIPMGDPTLLWINAGITPLKKYFDGSIVPQNKRMTSCQKCIRTNDIENVGITASHHTFFQMLGNFSIGDYFKKEAITWSWELLTDPKYFGMEKEKLYATIYKDDDEAYDIWINVGIDPTHIIRLENNYWEIGEGPCGPDSEIFYDRGEKYDPNGLGIKLLEEEISNDRYIEIWNNVFSQFNAKEGVNREDYEPLPNKNIDTGMGLERMACIIQECETNYDTDMFMPIMNKITEICGINYEGQTAFKVIADHVRTLCMAISDGAIFENVGRGYVLRRLLRRAVRHARKLNINRVFMSELVDTVISLLESAYPEIVSSSYKIKNLIKEEEELFHKTLREGEKKLENIFNTNTDKVINGEDAFKLYDTFGFPIELTIEYANDRGFTVDKEEFNAHMNAQKEMARGSRKQEGSMNLQNEELINYKDESIFVGYTKLGNETEVIGIMKDNSFVDSINDEGYVVLKENPFYAESGGQVSDFGYVKGDNVRIEVIDVIKAPNGQHLLKCKVLNGILKVGDTVLTHIVEERRLSIMKNHSAVHLLQKTLQEHFGNSVHQAGSKVDERDYRFDFIYHGRFSDELIIKIEEDVNKKIDEASDVQTEIMSLEDAKKKGALALFEDKYGSTVRVVTMGNSIELCGGTHVLNTKDINKFVIASIENKGSDTYRIIGSTDNNTEEVLMNAINVYNTEMEKLLEKSRRIITEACNLDIELDFNFDIDHTPPTSYKDVVFNRNELETLKSKVKELEKEFNNRKVSKLSENTEEFEKNKFTIDDVTLILEKTYDYDVTALKQIIDNLVNKYDKAFVLFMNTNGNNVNFIAKSNVNNDKFNCGVIVKKLSTMCNGNGGGTMNYASGGGNAVTDIDKIITNLKDELES